jgi:Skp family chaperone for outer membrane proteins
MVTVGRIPKKLAMAAIELARKAINAALKAIGAALLAISDVLLAAFPALKARFQGAIRKAVDKATDAVNRLADGLKQAVQKALDRLGVVLDQALQLLEKAINAIIDVANAVVQGAIRAAQAVVEMLGTWAKLIKDVVAGPGTWLGKLSSAVVDGIKNHLWSAFKTTVVEWFKTKVFELLGIGGVILELLLEGGLTKEHILEMAMDALLVAIPAALVAILVEKLVAMIVPAAGALMAIIEGLQAAWGTISRIIAAFAAFMAFLLAVKSGGAGALFASVLAGAVVIVLDFVANWLLKKLANAARKVGAKLKGLAEKFKAKRDAKTTKKHHDEHDSRGEKKAEDDHDKSDKERKKKEEKDKKNQETLAKAQRELPSKINGALQKRPGKLMFRARLAAWRLQYRLTSLQMVEQGDHFKVKATVNPSAELNGGFIVDVLAMLKRIGDRLLRENPEALKRAADRAEELGIDPSKAKAQRAYAPEDAEEHLAVAAHQKAQQPNREPRDRTLVHHGTVEDGGHVQSVHEKPGGIGERVQGDEVVRSVNPDGSASNAKKYTQLAQIFEGRGVTPQQLGEAMRSMSRGFGVPTSMRGSEKELGELMGLSFGTEASRDSRNPLFSMMAIEQLERGAPISSTLMQFPAEMRGHVRAAEGNRADLGGDDRSHRHKQPKIDELVKRQMEHLEVWFKMQTGGRELATASLADLEIFVEDMVRSFIRTKQR